MSREAAGLRSSGWVARWRRAASCSASGVLSSAWAGGALIDRWPTARGAVQPARPPLLGFLAGFAIQSGTPTWRHANRRSGCWSRFGSRHHADHPAAHGRRRPGSKGSRLLLGLGLMACRPSAFAAPPPMGAAIATHAHWRWGYAGIAIAIVLTAPPTTALPVPRACERRRRDGGARPARPESPLRRRGVTPGEQAGARLSILGAGGGVLHRRASLGLILHVAADADRRRHDGDPGRRLLPVLIGVPA